MAIAGLIGAEANPFTTAPAVGLAGLGPSMADLAITGQRIVGQNQFRMPELKAPPSIAVSESRRKFFVQGTVFDTDDAPAALQAEGLLNMPSTGLPTDGDWVPLTPGEYRQFLDSIRDPSRGRLMRKGFQTGVQQLRQLGGSALQLLGAEETGGGIVADAQREIEKRAPFQREFTDVDSGAQLVDWFVYNLGAQGPMMLESVAASLAGAAAGSVAAGPGLGTAGGFLAGIFGRRKFKQDVMTAARKYTAGQVVKGSPEYVLLRNASALAGAAGANFLSSQVIGAGDIYGEMREQGTTADDMGARITAFMGSFPYAAADSMTEFILAGRVLGGAMAPSAIPKGTSLSRRGLELLRRGAVGAGVGASLEGTTELGQEALVVGLSGQSLTDEAAVRRFINAFAAGAAIGGVVGGGANLLSGRNEEVNLLDNSRVEPPTSAPQMFGEPVGAPTLEAEFGVRPDRVAGVAGVRASVPSDTIYTGEVPPGQFGVEQGIIDLGGATIGELQQRGRETGSIPLQHTITPDYTDLPPNPAQGVLQFGGEAPSGIGFTDQQPIPNTLMAQQMAAALRRQQEDAAYAQRAQQEALANHLRLAGAAQERARQQAAQEARQQLQFAEDAAHAERTAAVEALYRPVSEAPARPPTQQQLPLFTRRQALQPSRAEGLRRGVGTQILTPKLPQPLTAAQRRAQLVMFTETGQPSLAALKSAARKQPIAAPVLEVGAVQIPPTGKLVTPQSIAAARADAEAKEAARKEKTRAGIARLQAKAKAEKEAQDAIQKRSAARVDVQEPPGDGERVRARDTPKRQAAAAPAPKESKVQAQAIDDAITAQQPAPTPAPVVEKTPAETWDTMATGITWAELPPTQRKRWESGIRTPALAGNIAEALANPQQTWDAMATGVEWVELPPTQRQEWFDSHRTQEDADRIAKDFLEADPTPMQMVEDDIRVFEETASISLKLDALRRLVSDAYLGGEDTNVKAANLRARTYLDSVEMDAREREAMQTTIVNEVNSRQRIEATYKDTKRSGQPKPWFEFALRNGLLNRVRSVIIGLRESEALELVKNKKLTLANFPDKTQQFIKQNLPDVTHTTKDKRDTRNNAAKQLADYIKDLNTKTVDKAQYKITTDKLTALWMAVQDAELDSYLDQTGTPLDAYFDDDGQPIINQIGNRLRVGTRLLSDDAHAKVDDDYEAPFSLDDWNIDSGPTGFDDGRFVRADGTPIRASLPPGRIRLLVTSFLNRLAKKPTVGIYRNQADLKAKNPRLYAQAVTSRPQGDFDAAPAVGYSFGNGQVLIFTDRVVTEQQLRFVLAHETLGHFGFRGLMTEQQLNAALDDIYNKVPKIKAAVGTTMASRGMGRREATEEYLADFAAVLDTNVLARFWNHIKNALNKLGVRFDDDIARYLVSQSRRYVRNGKAGYLVDAGDMGRRIAAIEGMTDPDGVGRFSLAGAHYDETNHIIAERVMEEHNFHGASEWLRRAKASGVNIRDAGEHVLGELKTMNYASRNNQGYRRTYEVLRDIVRSAMSVRSKYNDMMRTALQPAASVGGRQWTRGASQSDLDTVNKLLNVTSRVKHGQMTDSALRKLGKLVNITDGRAVLDADVYAKLRQYGMHSLEQFQKGFKFTELRDRPMTPAKHAELVVARDTALLGVEDAKKRKDITREYQGLLDSPSATYEVEVEFPAMPNLTADSYVWKMYNEVRSTMDESAVDVLLASYAAAKGEQVQVQTIAQVMLGRDLTDADKDYLRRISEKFLALRQVNEQGQVSITKVSEERAQKFIRSWNEALLADRRDKYQALLGEFFEGAAYDDAVAGIDALKRDSKIPKQGQERYAVQQAIQNLALSETGKVDAEMFAKRSIAGGYVPFGREGSWQVRIQAVDPKTGRVHKISERYRQQLLFVQVDNRAEAERIANDTNAMFEEAREDGLFDMEISEDGKRHIRQVRLVAQPETARETTSSIAQINLNEFTQVLIRFGVSLTPAERHRLIVGMTRQNDRARSRLQRLGTPGQDPNTLKYVAKHLEATASIVARKNHRHRLDKLFTEGDPESERLWRGDQVEYDRRKAAWDAAQKDPSVPEVVRRAAKSEFDDYHWTFVVKESAKMADRYKDRGRRLMSFLDSQTDVEFTDFASGEAASLLRMATTFAQLGGSFATGMLNVIALPTNVLPAMAGYNDKNGFGGGFGWAHSSMALTHAINAVKNPAQSDVHFWNELLADPDKLKASAFTEVEVRFMQKEVSAGSMQAALFNALLGSSRGRVTSGLGQLAAKTWMGLFTYTEQASRRATGLAVFRLAYDRALQEGRAMKLSGDALTEFAFDKADRTAVDMIDNTLGEYAMFNRSSFFRGDVRQFMFMYMMFPVNTIQMLIALPRKEQLLALAILGSLAGLKGLPFADDLMDLIDTIAHGLGLGPSALWKGTAERTLTEALDAVAPGMTPILWRGVVNNFLPANVADRVSLSNIVPGTGMGLANANLGRELLEIAGPIASFLQGTIVTAGNLTKYGLETVGLRKDTTTLTGILRESPVTMLRALGDIRAYSAAGAIVNQKGYVVSENLHWGTYLSRTLGFFPASSVRENDVVRVATRLGNYHRDIAATYRGMYISARLAKNEERVQAVLGMVQEWNESAQGTGLEIRNFVRSANRVLRGAQRPASERYQRYAPLGMRPETARIQELFGVEEGEY